MVLIRFALQLLACPVSGDWARGVRQQRSEHERHTKNYRPPTVVCASSIL